MGFFYNYDEVPQEDQPRKRGLARLWEMLGRDFMSFFVAGFLALVGMLPLAGGTVFALYVRRAALAPILGLAGGLIAGPQLCALADAILRSLRDDSGSWWRAYRQAWRRSVRAALLPGALGGSLLSTQIFLLFSAGVLGSPAPVGVALMTGLLLTLGLSSYLWPLLALTELPFLPLIKDAALLFLAQLPRSLAALAVVGLYWGVVLWFFPLAAPMLPLTNLWLPTLPAVMLVYPGIERAFHVEEKPQ